jgi:hypothetical protein
MIELFCIQLEGTNPTGVLVYIYYSSYSGDLGRRITSLRSTRAKVRRLCLKNERKIKE